VDVDEDGTRQLLLRVETEGAVAFHLESVRSYQSAPEPEPHRPRYPSCELSKPDFSNPNCCQAKCLFGKKHCTAVVTSAPEGKSTLAGISIGTDFGIMAGARATLSVRGKFVAFGRVLAVAEHSSVVALERISDASKISNADVVLDRPSECAP